MANFQTPAKFRQCYDGKFECLLCNNKLSSKQRVLIHLNNTHNQSPLRRQKKLYLDDDTVPVPKRTLLRWKARQLQKNFDSQGYSTADTLSEPYVKEPSLPEVFKADETYMYDTWEESSQDSHTSSKDQSLHKEFSCTPEKMHLPECVDTSHSTFIMSNSMLLDEILNSDDDNFVSDDQCISGESSESVISSVSSNFNTEDHDSNVLTSSSDFDCRDSENSDLLCVDTDNEDSSQFTKVTDGNELPQKEFEALSLISCFLRNRFSASTSRDVLNTFKSTFPDCEELSKLDYENLMSNIENTDIKEFHYCVTCKEVFPSDENVYRCGTQNCDGFRYKGDLSNQEKKGRQPRQCFVFTDINKQLEDLLKTPGIWEDIQRNREAAYERKVSGSSVLTDITDGASYRAMMVEDGFLDWTKHNLTAVFNTDGVNLYSSSKIELWPIYLAINELSPALRFSRDNIILLGMWQGKGKPPFQQFFGIFTEEMNTLFKEGVEVQIGEHTYNVKLSVLCGIFDLPAKAEVLNMSYFNGQKACITCEEPGITVRQGKGHAKCYPYRGELRYPIRSHINVTIAMNEGSDRNRCEGFKGTSPLINLEGYNMVDGTVPDYMHGVLLGITKTLLCRWLSPSESHKKYFVGKHIKVISKRMNTIKPPQEIERLPRDLEKHYMHFKATELQSWLLYYSIPCLEGFLENEYMENLVYFSNAVYILLGDQITAPSLEKAVDLLHLFYSSFQQLYGDGTCGLNVHNAAYHLPEYVKLWGPVWCWSCFPFEDANAMLLQAVHGTGSVLKQVMKYRQANLYIRKKGLTLKKATTWKITFEARNCDIAGAVKKLGESEKWGKEQLSLLYADVTDAKKVDRIIVNERKFFSAGYSRMQKRICNVVTYSENSVGEIKYFVMCENVVYAVIMKMDTIPLSQLPGALESHLIPVKDAGTLVMVNVDELCNGLVFVNTRIGANAIDPYYVCRFPNRFGHAVFK